MHQNILNKEQNDLLPLIKEFNSSYGLVGGTAIALQIGHRQSVDFDLFTEADINQDLIRKKIKKLNLKIDHLIIESFQEFSIVINQTKITFYQFPFSLEFEKKFNGWINLPNLETLGAMKVFALGKRNAWRDYVDLFFIFKEIGVDKVIHQAKIIFGGEFNLKFFKAQLIYYQDLEYQPLDFMPGYKQSNQTIKNYLEKISLSL